MVLVFLSSYLKISKKTHFSCFFTKKTLSLHPNCAFCDFQLLKGISFCLQWLTYSLRCNLPIKVVSSLFAHRMPALKQCHLEGDTPILLCSSLWCTTTTIIELTRGTTLPCPFLPLRVKPRRSRLFTKRLPKN